MLPLGNKAWSHLDGNAKVSGGLEFNPFIAISLFLHESKLCRRGLYFLQMGRLPGPSKRLFNVKDCFFKPLGMLMSSLH